MSNPLAGSILDGLDPNTPFKPVAYYDEDGDCIEFFAKRGPFYAKRLDDLITVYYSSESDEIVGSLIKAIKPLLSKHRGATIDIRQGKIRIVHLIRARAWQEGDPELVRVYGELIEIAGDTEAELETACS